LGVWFLALRFGSVLFGCFWGSGRLTPTQAQPARPQNKTGPSLSFGFRRVLFHAVLGFGFSGLGFGFVWVQFGFGSAWQSSGSSASPTPNENPTAAPALAGTSSHSLRRTRHQQSRNPKQSRPVPKTCAGLGFGLVLGPPFTRQPKASPPPYRNHRRRQRHLKPDPNPNPNSKITNATKSPAPMCC
jgi:hypothetical protein